VIRGTGEARVEELLQAVEFGGGLVHD
jgi:hypothetical protein